MYRRSLYLAIVCALSVQLAAAAACSAATLTYTDSVPLQKTEWIQSLTLPKFDPSLGTLNSVSMTLDVYVEGSARIENRDAQPATITTRMCAEVRVFDGADLLAAFPAVERSDDLAAFDGLSDFGGTSGKTYSLLSASDSQSATITLPAALTPFIGTGNMGLSAQAKSLSAATGAGNLRTSFGVNASAEVTIVYDYEPPVASIGDFVWEDTNADGIQGFGEPGVANVTVELYTCDGSLVSTTVTDADGYYLFPGLAPGSYSVKFIAPTGYALVQMDQGSDDAIDSDANPLTGTTACTILTAGEDDLTWDAGLYRPASLGDLVWIDSDADGVYEPEIGEVGVCNALVTIAGQNGFSQSMYTSCGPMGEDRGWYLFTGLLPQTYTVTVAPANFAVGGPLYRYVQTYDLDMTLDNRASYTLASGETFLDLDFGYRPYAWPGTGTPGYWKNHPEAWPVELIEIGGVVYTKAQAIAWLKTSNDKDKTLTLFRALVCAKLNIGVGNDSSPIEEIIRDADDWMVMHGPAGSGVKASSSAWKVGEPYYTKLDAYNNGRLGVPHRD